MEIFLLITVVIIFLLTWMLSLKKKNKRAILMDRIPGPVGYPIIGNLKITELTENQWTYFRNIAKEYYPIYKRWNGHVPLVVLLYPDDIEILLTSKKHLKKGKIYEWLEEWLGTGLLTSSGEKWFHRRKILTPAFHFNILQHFTEIFRDQSEILTEKLKEECDKEYTEIVPIITKFTLHSICETAMGTQLDEKQEQSKEYVKAVYRMAEILIYRFARPWLFFAPIFSLLPEFKEKNKLLQILHKFSMSVIEERKANLTETDLHKNIVTDSFKSKKRLAMLDLLISAQRAGVNITDEGIREEVDTFMFEGHDTTTAAICFTLMLLANHPDIQNKVAEEVFEVLGNSQCSIVFQDLSKLRYLEQVIKESLRIYPSVPLIGRYSEEELLTATGYIIPANVYCQIGIIDLHYNPRFYPDPFKFDPDRFSVENSRHRHPFAYLPFSAGPRNCIGQRFAMLELKLVLASILRKFILHPVDRLSDIKIVSNLILKTTPPIKVKFEER